MNCNAARRAIGAEPDARSPELDAHLLSCESCVRYLEETQLLDQRIRRALAITLSADGARTASPAVARKAAARSRYSRGWALAAGVVLSFAIGLMFWSAWPRSALATAVLDHMKFEPHAWIATAPLEQGHVAETLGKFGIALGPLDGEIVFVQRCWVRDKWVPHFVVRTASGPYTVLVLPEEPVSEPERFAEGGYTGILLPAERGSIAVLNRNSSDPEPAARVVLRALRLDGARG